MGSGIQTCAALRNRRVANGPAVRLPPNGALGVNAPSPTSEPDFGRDAPTGPAAAGEALRTRGGRVPFAVFVLAVACLLPFGCGTRGLQEDNSSGILSLHCFKVAPIIVVGTITTIRDIGPARRSRKDSHPLIGPVEITVSVENVLKGAVARSAIQVFGFRWREQYVRGGLFAPYPGDRCLFLLRRDSGRLRLLVDSPEGSLAVFVYSGEHRDLEPRAYGDAGRAMAALLLTLGPGADLAGFRGYIIYYAKISMAASGDAQWVISLLKPLTMNADEIVRASAGAAIEAIDSGKWSHLDGPCTAKLD